MLARIVCFLLMSTPVTAAPYFVHCYDFGCKTTQEIHFSNDHWRRIRAIFGSGEPDPGDEKQAIRRAVAMMERISGDIAGTFRDKAGNYPGYDAIRQMDCIDESTNTFQYLLALERLGLLRHHRVDLKYRRIVWLASHWTATIAEIEGDRLFAVDSWDRDNGEMPMLQPLEDWRRKRRWPHAYNPELAAH